MRSLSILKGIKSYVQQVAEAIAAVIDFEVAIIDNKLEVVAGTGKYQREIGNIYGENSITSRLCKGSYETVFIDDPGQSPNCKDCERINSCDILGGLVCPIIINEVKIIGTLSIFAYSKRQLENLQKNNQQLIQFVSKVATLISHTITEKQMNEKISFMAKQFSVVMDSVHEGMIAIDVNGLITHFNHSAEILLNCKSKDVINKSILEIFPHFNFAHYLKGDEKRIDKELTRIIGNQTLKLVASITSIKNADGTLGAVISFRSKEEIYALANKFVEEERFTFNHIQGVSQKLVDIKEKMKRVAPTDSTILIRGESGTGKELFARAIHNASLRKNKPFVAINCGAIPENLLESELFGYEEGAFTGAKKGGKIGRFELANKGTIFLDEIGDMPHQLQVKILRVLEERKIERVGGIQTIPVDVRIIAATHQNLEEMISKGKFRSDLFYRLNVIPFIIPLLKERKEDVILLSRFFMEKFSKKMGKDILGFSKEAENILLNYSWPGNVRELENAIEYAVNLETSNLIDGKNLPGRIYDNYSANSIQDEELPTISELEKRAIIKAVRRFGNTTEGKEMAAKTLGISLTTVYRRLKEIKSEDLA
ncbi:MAG: sigma 54-interacting transcriptional regulator [Bacillota bacterium]|nr:sigma 54-interacting transcriptional regulator [Bacillota bacterium]